MNKDPISISVATASGSKNAKDGGSAAGFLSKASSSLRRSPSRRHKSQPSNHLPSVDKIFYEQKIPPAIETSPPSIKKPDVHRLQTTSLESRPSQSSLKETRTPQSAVESILGAGPYSSTGRKDSTSSLSKIPGAMFINGDMGHPASADGKTPLTPALPSTAGNQNPHALFQHIQELSTKRISTLDYFRKA